MTTFEECEVCGTRGMMCPHRPDISPALTMFQFPGEPARAGSTINGVHEFQFFGSGGADEWLVDGPGYGVATPASEETLPADPAGFRYVDFLRSTWEPGRLALDVSSSTTPTASLDSLPRSPTKETTAAEKAPTTSMMSFSGNSTLTTSAAEGNTKEAERSVVALEGDAIAMDREARVLRYREKKKRRKFEKQIRYASRKAYAEMRPRVKGRFAKVPEAGQPSEPSAPYSTAGQLDFGWYQYQP